MEMTTEKYLKQYQATTSKEYLMQYQVALSMIKRKQEQIEKLRADLLPSGISYDGMPSGGTGKTTADLIAKIDELERQLRIEQSTAAQIAGDVISVIERVEDDKQRAILHDRYISGLHWNRIADKMHYSYRHVTKLHGKALLEISKILKDAPQCPI